MKGTITLDQEVVRATKQVFDLKTMEIVIRAKDVVISCNVVDQNRGDLDRVSKVLTGQERDDFIQGCGAESVIEASIVALLASKSLVADDLSAAMADVDVAARPAKKDAAEAAVIP